MMNNKFSKKTRLLTLIFMGLIPGGHRFYTGHYRTAVVMLITSLLINLNIFILAQHLPLDYFINYSKNFSLIMGFIALLILSSLCLGEVILILAILALAALANYWQILNFSKIFNIDYKLILNITVLLLWFLALRILLDLILIAVGLFKDDKKLPLARLKVHHEISRRSNIVAILLCICFAITGLHRFYLKRYRSGLIMLTIGTITFIAWPLIIDFLKLPRFINNIGNYAILILQILLNVWAFIDLFRLCAGTFTDANNKLPRDYSSFSKNKTVFAQ